MNKKIKIVNVVGARPNFIKIAPIIREMDKVRQFDQKLIHTGQHYDMEMSDLFFKELNIRAPDLHLGISGGSHAHQTGLIMAKLEKIFMKIKPDLVLVVGDVNSTLAASLAAVKLHISVVHVEAGLRSFDRTMPEEINRIITDRLSDYLFTTSRDANKNLLNEGIPQEKIHFVGNVMIDTLEILKSKALKYDSTKKYKLRNKSYAYLTLHRPSNVDEKKKLENLLKSIAKISKTISVVFPAHPRTKKQIEKFRLGHFFKNSNTRIIEPLGYLNSLNLILNSKFVITDSGGIQEETTVLNIPCLTVRENTERPVTVTKGTNTVVGNSREKLIGAFNRIMNGNYKKGSRPELWDGNASRRIVKILAEKLIV